MVILYSSKYGTSLLQLSVEQTPPPVVLGPRKPSPLPSPTLHSRLNRDRGTETPIYSVRDSDPWIMKPWARPPLSPQTPETPQEPHMDLNTDTHTQIPPKTQTQTQIFRIPRLKHKPKTPLNPDLDIHPLLACRSQCQCFGTRVRGVGNVWEWASREMILLVLGLGGVGTAEPTTAGRYLSKGSSCHGWVLPAWLLSAGGCPRKFRAGGAGRRGKCGQLCWNWQVNYPWRVCG